MMAGLLGSFSLNPTLVLVCFGWLSGLIPVCFCYQNIRNLLNTLNPRTANSKILGSEFMCFGFWLSQAEYKISAERFGVPVYSRAAGL